MEVPQPPIVGKRLSEVAQVYEAQGLKVKKRSKAISPPPREVVPTLEPPKSVTPPPPRDESQESLHEGDELDLHPPKGQEEEFEEEDGDMDYINETAAEIVAKANVDDSEEEEDEFEEIEEEEVDVYTIHVIGNPLRRSI